MRHSEQAVAWRCVAQVFSRPVLAQLARSGSGEAIRKALVDAGLVKAGRRSLAELLDAALDELRKHYRCEYIYKAAVADRIVFGRHSPRTASLHVELPVGRSIVDAAVFNGTSTAYEIKTELDSDRRLSTQTFDYLRAFERVYLVTHPSLAERYQDVLDHRVGILTLNSRGSLSEIRKADTSRQNLNKLAMLRLLRSSEYCEALENLYGEQPSLPNGRRFQHYSRLWQMLSVDEAHAITVNTMRARTTSPDISKFLEKLPSSYRVLGYATPLSHLQRTRILNAFL